MLLKLFVRSSATSANSRDKANLCAAAIRGRIVLAVGHPLSPYFMISSASIGLSRYVYLDCFCVLTLLRIDPAAAYKLLLTGFERIGCEHSIDRRVQIFDSLLRHVLRCPYVML